MNGWVWSNGGMILTGENWSAGRKTLYSVGGRWMDVYGAMVEWYWQGKTEVVGERESKCTSSVTNPTWNNLVSKLGLRGQRPKPSKILKLFWISFFNLSQFISTCTNSVWTRRLSSSKTLRISKSISEGRDFLVRVHSCYRKPDGNGNWEVRR